MSKTIRLSCQTFSHRLYNHNNKSIRAAFPEMRKRMSLYNGASGATLVTIDTISVSEAERLERKSFVLWRRPLKTLQYSILETYILLQNLVLRALDRRLAAGVLIILFAYIMPGPHQKYMQLYRQHISFALYWVFLGLLSSVGFGAGLHTFLLYLGPHIATVTLAAYECQSLEFPIPPYPDQKICPVEPYVRHAPNVWNILAKVRMESLLWGFGTALGELPPYFMARASRLSGRRMEERPESAELSFFERSKLLLERIVLRIGFLGILLCASVPNPFFDLAGVACGHFLVPFWKFFIATMIGKAFFKATLQQVIVVIAFSDELVNTLITSLGQVPWLGPKLQSPVQNVLTATKVRMHRHAKEDSFTGLNLVAFGFQLFALVIVVIFVVTLLDALAQKHCMRLQELEKGKNVSPVVDAVQQQPTTSSNSFNETQQTD